MFKLVGMKMESMEKRFNEDMKQIYQRAKKELNYNTT